MKSVLQLTSVLLILMCAACSTAPKTRIHSSAPESSSPGASSPASASESGLPDTGASLPTGEYTILIESTPSGGMVVVNGIPVGRAPQRIVIPGTGRGFFREQLSLKVRFIAADSNSSSQTVEELMTPLDRIPAVLKFTSTGVTRVSR